MPIQFGYLLAGLAVMAASPVWPAILRDPYRHVYSPAELESLRGSAHTVFARVIAGHVLYLRISSFHAATAVQVRQAIQNAYSGVPFTGVILDLRSNRGGLLNAAVEVSDAFIDAGVLARTHGLGEIPDLEFRAGSGGELLALKTVVLMDRRTASAAELLAGILRVSAHATLAGQRSYGKSAVQSLDPQPDGSILAHTVSHYYFADGTSVPKRGLRPDVIWPQHLTSCRIPQTFEQTENLETDSVIRAALKLLEQAIEHR